MKKGSTMAENIFAEQFAGRGGERAGGHNKPFAELESVWQKYTAVVQCSCPYRSDQRSKSYLLKYGDHILINIC